MIRPLRITHRLVFFAMAIVLPLLLASGLLSRRRALSVPATLENTTLEHHEILSEKVVVANGMKYTVRILRDSSHTSSWQVQLIPNSLVVAPDVLVYWAEDPPQTSLPTAALFLGPFRPSSTYALPRDKGQGVIILYSLAHAQTFTVIRLEKLP